MNELHLSRRNAWLVKFAQAVQFKRPTLADEVAKRNLGRADWQTARRSAPARSANHELT